MDFRVKKIDIVKELTLMQGIVEKRTTIPILSNFLVTAEGEDLSFQSTDLEISLRNTCPATVKEEGTAVLPTRTVYDIIRALPDVEIHFKTGEEEAKLHLDCGSAKYRIATLPPEDFPQVKEIEDFPISVRTEHLARVLNDILFAVSSEESRFPVTGALFVFKKDSMFFVSTDGHRLSKVEVNETPEGIKETVKTIVPRKALMEMKKIIDLEESEKVSIAMIDNQAFFRFGGRLLMTRLLEAEFPKYEKVIPKKNDKIFMFERREIEQAIRHVAAISADKAQGIKFEFTKGTLLISNSVSELGEAKEQLPTGYDGEPFEIGFNIQYLLDFFTHCEQDRVIMELKDASAAGLFHPDDEEVYSYRYILMPMKI